jgi:ribosome biogenesis GTPase A
MAFKGQPGKAPEAYWDVIRRIIIESDLVLEVLDARLVELSRNEEVERLIKEVGRPMIFVVNKCDLVSKESLKKQVKELRKSGDVVFVSTKKKGGSKVLLYQIKKVFKKYGKRYVPPKNKFTPKAEYREARANIVVGILGYPNVGKSSIINALAHKKKVKVSKRSGTTHGVHWINVTQDIKLLDSPGVIPLVKEDEIRYGLIGARDTEALKNPELVAHAVIKLFLKKNKKALEEFYKIDIENEDVEDIVGQLALKKGFLLKGGKADKHRLVMIIVRDWQQGRLRL